MRMQDAARQHPPFDAPAGMVALLKSQGFHEFKEVKPEPVITVSWHVRRGVFLGDYECPPMVCYTTTAGEKGYCESQNGTAHRTLKVRTVDGGVHVCPNTVGEEYERIFAEWKAKSRNRQPTEKVSAATPLHILNVQAAVLPEANLTPWQRAELRKS